MNNPIRTMLYLSFFLLVSTPFFAKLPQPTGKIDLYTGSLGGGKSDEVIRIARRYEIANRHKPENKHKIAIFKPELDTRSLNKKNARQFITSRSGSSIECIAVESVQAMEQIVEKEYPDVIIIDEAQFMEKEPLVTFVKSMRKKGKHVILAGLDLDFRGETFGAMGELAAQANNVIKIPAICAVCAQDTFCITQRLINGEPAAYDSPTIIVEGSDAKVTYEPRCVDCHICVHSSKK